MLHHLNHEYIELLRGMQAHRLPVQASVIVYCSLFIFDGRFRV